MMSAYRNFVSLHGTSVCLHVCMRPFAKATNWGVEVDISPACGRLQVKLPGGVMMSAYRNFVSQAGMLFAWYVC